jgi:predicted amidophosphoribosyltransferase
MKCLRQTADCGKSGDTREISTFLSHLIKFLTSLIIELVFPIRNTSKHTCRDKKTVLNIYKHIDESSGYINNVMFPSWKCGEYHYEPLKKLIWEAKYKNDPTALDICALILSDEIIACLCKSISPIHHRPILVGVPSTSHESKERSVDQIKEILKRSEVLIHNFIDKSDTILLKIRPNKVKRQSETSNKSERLKNATNRFDVVGRIDPNVPILLVDDVITTGATIADCIRALKQAGAVHIYCISLAH